jgi:multiple sugar transport system ATP-binding protein
MRMVAGLEDPTGGDILIDGERVNDVDARDRDVAMVFQSYALYPNMSIYENIRFPLRMRNVPKDQHDKLVREAANMVELGDYLDRKPKALSGGQRQRAALARAIVRHPRVFLMDEPLSNLDAKLRLTMRAQLKHIQKQAADHDDLCDPRPDRSHDAGRPGGHHGQGQDPAAWNAG